MTKFCMKCGQPLAPGSRFCQACGTPVPQEQPLQVQQPVPPQQPVQAPQGVQMQQAAQMPPAPQGVPPFPPPVFAGPCVPDQGLVQKFFNYKGRLNRKPYAIRTVIMIVLPLVAASMLGGSQQGAGPAMLVSLAAVVSCVMLAVRRLNDMGKPAYLAGLIALPLVAGFISPARAATFGYISLGFSIYLAAVEGMKGPNQHGPDPLSGPENEW